MPPKPIRDLRLLTRYRRTQIAERKREAQRLHKALEDTGIKLDCVATDILGKSGRAMLDALVAGTTDPEVLADLALGKLRKKIPALREALQGRYEPLHALLIGAILSHLDFLDEQITGLSEAIEEQMLPFAAARDLLMTIPGVGQRTAEVIIAEIGTDMSVFPLRRTRRGSKNLNYALKDAAMAAMRTNDSYLRRSTSARSPKPDTAARSARSSTRSSAPAGTCSPPARSTPTSAATTTSAATPNARPNASSLSSNDSATASRCRRPTQHRLNGFSS